MLSENYKKYILYAVVAGIMFIVALLWLLPDRQNAEGTLPSGQQNNLFPLAKNVETVPQNTVRDEDKETATNSVKKISDGVSEGLAVFDSVLFFTNRASGNVYSYTKGDERPKRITNTTIAGVVESFFSQNEGSVSVINRYLTSGAIQTFAGNANMSTSSDHVVELEGAIISGDIPSLSTLPSSNKIFFLDRNSSGVTGYISDADGKNRKIVFESLFTEWLPTFINSETVALQTRPSIGIDGFLYYLDINTGSLEKVIGSVKGLSALPSPDGNKVVYSESTLSSFKSYILNKSLTEPIPLSVQLIPEKCVWKSDSSVIYCAIPNETLLNDFPDPWYRGEKTFSDNIWAISSQTGEVFVLLATEIETNGSITFDAITPVLDESNSILYFIDKKNSSLWSVDLAGIL